MDWRRGSACGRGDLEERNFQERGVRAASRAASSQPKLLSAEDEALTAKLQPFVQCINDVDANLQKAVGEYRRFFAQEQEELAGTRDRLGFGMGSPALS